MTRVLMFTDYHISSQGRRTLQRLSECMETAFWLGKLIEDQKPDLVVNLGDTFDDHASLDVPSLCTGIRAMRYIKNACDSVAAPFVIIAGNHDAHSRDYSSLEAFVGIATLSSNPDLITVKGTKFGTMPFTKRYDVADRLMKGFEKENAAAVFAHIDVEQACYTGPSSKGPNTITKEGLNPFAYRMPIFCGHYHHPADLGAFKFIGSVLYHQFSDEVIPGKPRGATLATFENGKLVHTKVFPNPCTVTYEKIEWTGKRPPKLPPVEDRAKIHISVKCNEKDAEKARAHFDDAGFASVRVVIEREVEQLARVDNVTPETNPFDVVASYVQNKGANGLDEDRLKACGSEAIKNALTKGKDQ